jgi:hypothetical protein
MFGDVAVRLLKLMGHSGTVPSAFKPEDIPAALQRLKKAVAEDDASIAAQGESDTHDDDDEPVSLRNRALPLIQLLEAAEKEQEHVMWNS